MAEYIEREALRDALYDADAIMMSGIKILNQFPAADVEPVRHGQWIKCEDGTCYCSECNQNPQEWYERAIKALNYYPNCGVKMDGGADV